MKHKILLVLIVFLAFFLRVYRISEIPPALYWDEASIGYNAYSIATTLHDEHGNFLPVSNFPAFGDYKAPGYIYAAAASIKIFGLSEFSIRLPSVLAGTLLVLVTFFLVKELLTNPATGLLASLFVAVSPWSLQLSRGAFESNLATLFSASGIYFFLHAVRSKSTIRYLLAAICFVASMYSFNSHRVFVPLLIGTLSLIFHRELILSWKKSLPFYLLSFILLLPLIPHLLSPEGKLRFNEVSWVNDTVIVENANKLIADHGNSIFSKIIYNRRVLYGQEFLKHYLDHFRFDFLFLSGDINPRLSTRSVGLFYLIDLIPLLFGALFLLRQKSKTSLVLISWLVLGIVPAAVAKETPHALRILTTMPVPQILTAVGLVWLVQKQKWLPLIVIFGYVFYLIGCLYNYYSSYPNELSSSWQYGYKQAVEYTKTVENKYDHVSVTNFLGRPYIYFLLYNQYPPEKFWQNRDASKDRFGFWTVSSFDKFVFDSSGNGKGRWLYIRAPSDTPINAKILYTIRDSTGAPVFNFYDNL